MTSPTSFSGAHPFRPQCLAALLDDEYLDAFYGTDADEHLAHLVTEVDSGRCPRCGRDLPTGATRPSGSRVTRCRCIPVCGPCGEHEIADLVGPNDWPAVSPSEVDEWRAEMLANAKPGIVTESTVITEEGASEIRPRPHPGGWAEFGYDDSRDQAERES